MKLQWQRVLFDIHNGDTAKCPGSLLATYRPSSPMAVAMVPLMSSSCILKQHGHWSEQHYQCPPYFETESPMYPIRLSHVRGTQQWFPTAEV